VTDRRVDWDRVLRIVNEGFDQAVEIYRTPITARRRSRVERLKDDAFRSARAANPRNRAGFARLLPAGSEELSREVGCLLLAGVLTGYAAVVQDEIRTGVAVDQRDIAWALAEYRNDRGEYPPALKDLSPKYMPEIPKDPFAAGSAADYHYLRRGTGYLLYSVGPDGRDDGGRNASDDAKRYDRESDPSKIPDDIAIRTPEEKP
jgi:hypothetical protein